MIHCVTGKPGGGKTLHAVRLICERLRMDRSVRVVTNLPLLLGPLNEYLQGCDVPGRVRLLNEEEVPDFFFFRGPAMRDGHWVDVRGAPGPGDSVVWPDWADWPVLYVLDEAHLYWNAREWAKTGRRVLWYLSQHRKRGDTVVWITQHTGNVDKQFRVLTQDWTVCSNWGYQRFRGFRLPARFRVEVSVDPPDKVGRVVEETRLYRPDRTLFGLYDTSAGVGMPGAMRPEPKVRKGPPWWVGVGGILLLVGAAVYFVPRFVGGLVSSSYSAFSSAASRFPQQPAGAAALGAQDRAKDGPVGQPPAPLPATHRRQTASWQLPDGRAFVAFEFPDGESVVYVDGREHRRFPGVPQYLGGDSDSGRGRSGVTGRAGSQHLFFPK